jgi:hypothetical protein
MMLAPWFLAGLLAIGIPLWLHRIARSERIKVPFASLMLLEASEVRDTSRRDLRYWLLLAVRILFLVLLVLAFAQPIFKSSNPLGAKDAQLHAIVLDTSLSMQYGDRWTKATEEARKILDNLKSDERALVVAASGRKIELLGGPVLSRDVGKLRAVIASVQPGLERLDYGMLMTSSSAWLSADGAPTLVHLISDLQQSASPLRFADLAPPANTRVQVHDVGGAASNAAITAVNVQGAEDRVLTATIRGDAADKTPRELMLTIDDQKIATQRVIFKDENSVQLAFTIAKLRAGNHRLRLELQPRDALAQDDTYYAVIEHAEPTVLLLSQDPAADEATYLASAIESQSAMRLTVVRATPQSFAKEISARPISDFSAVFVTDSGILSDAIARQLQTFVASGGAVFAALGPRAAKLQAEPITGMALRGAANAEMRIGSIDDSHPVLRDATGWHAVRFMKHFDVRMAETDRALITLGDQTPLLIERAGAGRLLVLNAPLDRDWNDLPIHPLFVRFIADAARYLTDRDANAMAYPIGSRVATGLTGAGGQIFDPSGERVLSLDNAADAGHLTPNKAGFYEVRSGQEKHWLAINPDVRESDLSAMTPENVARWQELAPGATPALQNKATVAADSAANWELGWYLLIAAAILLALELLLANYRLTIRRDGTRAAPLRESPAGQVS